jgi:multidrug efflux pump subunit AcrB
MISYFASHKTAANLLMILLLAVGVLSLPDLKRETFPELPVDEIEITVVYSGATSTDVEEAICRRIEDAIDAVEGVEEVRSEARESLGRVIVEIVEGADVQIVFDDIRIEVDAIDDFPDRTEAPVIRQLGRTQPVGSIAVVGAMPLRDLKALCEQLKARMLRDPGIEIVNVAGFSDHQIRIEVPADVLMQYGLSATTIANTVRQQSLDVPMGVIETRNGDVIARFTDERRTPHAFEQLVILGGPSGGEIRLGEIARITDEFEEDQEKFVFNGQRSGLLEVKKTREQDTLVVIDAIKDFIEAENAAQPAGVRLHLTQDMSSIVRDRLEMLVRNGWQGFALVFLSLWLFLGFRLSFWVAMGLPVSFLGAFFVMTWIGYSINMLTMVSLLLALGLLMDDAIVLAENIATHLARGKSSLQAAIRGALEVRNGVFSSFATTIAVFGPISFLEGHIGAVLKVLPVVLILVLAVSLIEAFLILPGHLAHAHSRLDSSAKRRVRHFIDGWVERAREGVLGRGVDLVVRWRYLSAGVAIMVLAVSFSLIPGGVLKFTAFPDIDGNVVVARVLLPQGTSLTRTEQIVTRISDAFDRVNEEFRPRQPDGHDLKKSISVRYNVNADAFESGSHVATVTVDLLDAETRDAPLVDVLQRWREEVGDVPDVVSLVFAEPAFGPAGRPIEIRLGSPDLDECKHASLEVQDWLSRYVGVYDIMDDLRPGKPEIRVRMKEGGASLGLNAKLVSDQIRAALHGETAGEVQVGPESYEIDVRLDSRDRDSLADLEYFYLTLPGGAQVPVDAVAALEEGRGHARIARVDGQRTVTVLANVNTNEANVSALMSAFQKDEVPQIVKRHPSMDIDLKGEIDTGAVTQKSMMRGFLLGLIGVFLILSFQFKSYLEPLVVMMAIPMCLIGVIWGHVLMGLDITLPSMLGFVSLAGIVVNDSLLLVEFIKMRRREGHTVEVASAMASRLRFRAVLLTSVTTIAGMVPLLLETSLQAQILIPLATSVVFGLATSTFLVLLLVPALYTILGDLGLVASVAD